MRGCSNTPERTRRLKAAATKESWADPDVRAARSVGISQAKLGHQHTDAAKRKIADGATKHGALTSNDLQLRRTYYAWGAMKQRCYNPDNQSYDDYGGRGITVCRRWLHPENGFQNFLDDMGVKPAGTELDRRNNNRGYSPANCRWVTAKVNGNNKRNNVHVTHGGQTKTVAQWADKLGLSYETFRWRVKQGWTGAKLFQPARPRS